MACSASRVIPIRLEQPPAPATVVEPVLEGSRDGVQRVLGALGPSIQVAFGRPVLPGEWLQALQLGDGQASVQLRHDLGCRTREVAGSAFETLRRLLPDTDIYVGL